MKEKSWLVEYFLDEGNIFAENLFDEGTIVACVIGLSLLKMIVI